MALGILKQAKLTKVITKIVYFGQILSCLEIREENSFSSA